MFTAWKVVWTIFMLSTCNIKNDGEWSCDEGCLVCKYSPLAQATLIEHEQEFVNFADDYLKHYENPRGMKRAANKFLKLIYDIQIQLSQGKQDAGDAISIHEQKSIRKHLMKTWLKLDSLAIDELDVNVLPEYQGIRSTLTWTLKGLHDDKKSA